MFKLKLIRREKSDENYEMFSLIGKEFSPAPEISYTIVDFFPETNQFLLEYFINEERTSKGSFRCDKDTIICHIKGNYNFKKTL